MQLHNVSYIFGVYEFYKNKLSLVLISFSAEVVVSSFCQYIYWDETLFKVAMIASCRCYIAIALFLLCGMTQTAPVHLEVREVSGQLSDKTQQFYCTSVLQKNLAKFMVQVNKLAMY